MRIEDLPNWHQMKVGELKTAEEVLAYVEKYKVDLPEEKLEELAAGKWEAPDRSGLCPFCEKTIYWNGSSLPRSCPYCSAQF